MDVGTELLADAEAAIRRFMTASTPALERRALRESLAHLYALQEYAKQDPNYFTAAEGAREGRVMLAVLYVRGKLVHDVTTTQVDPERIGGDFNPEHFDLSAFDCGVLCWLSAGAADPQFAALPNDRARLSRKHYSEIARRPVRDTLIESYNYLEAAVQPSTAQA